MNKYYILTTLFVLLVKSMHVHAQWNIQTSNTTEDLHDIYFLNTSVGFTVGNNGTILKTTDGGTNWSKITSPVNKNLNEIFFSNLLTGYVAGDSGTVLKTTNGGNSWTTQTTGMVTALNSIYFISDTGVAVGDNGLIIRTSDGGTNWSPVPSPTIFILHAVIFTSGTIGYAIGANGTILKTADGGLNWIAKNSITAETLCGIDFLNDSIGYVAGTNSAIYKTTNGGDNWFSITISVVSNEWLKAIECPDNGICYVVGNNGLMLKSFADTAWSILTIITAASIQSLCMLNTDTGYAAGASGLILKTVNSGVNSMHEIFGDENININVFPNPFSIATEIEIRKWNLEIGRMKFVIYDWLGQKVFECAIDNPQSEIQKGNLSSGIYIYKVLSFEKIICSGKLVVE